MAPHEDTILQRPPPPKQHITPNTLATAADPAILRRAPRHAVLLDCAINVLQKFLDHLYALLRVRGVHLRTLECEFVVLQRRLSGGIRTSVGAEGLLVRL